MLHHIGHRRVFVRKPVDDVRPVAEVDARVGPRTAGDVQDGLELLVAIDRERISKDVYQGLAFPAMNAIPEQFTQLTDTSVDYNKQFAYDPAKAGKMLDEAGYPLKDGKRFSLDFTSATNADAFYAEPAAQIISANCSAVAISLSCGTTLLTILCCKHSAADSRPLHSVR